MKMLEKGKYGIVPLLGMFLCIVFALSNAITVKAEELQEVEGSMEGILQAGNLLEPSEGKIATYSVRSGKAQAEQAIIEAMERMDDSVDISGYQIHFSGIQDIVSRVKNNNPQLFYVERCVYYYNESSGIVAYLEFTYYDSPDKLKMAYETKVYSLLAKVNDSWSDMEKVVFINDYIASHCAYDEAALQNSPAPHTYDAYGVLVNGQAVCQGYAEAFLDLMNRLGIPCELVTSKSLNHAWNVVQIGNCWYHVDVTWNDPVTDLIGRARHYYLLKSTNWFQDEDKGNHNASDYVFSGSGTSAIASSTLYDDYFWNDVDTAFVYAAGDWYGIVKGTGKLNKYSADASGFTFKEEICAISDRWSAGGNSYYIGCFSSLGFLNGSLYYSTPKEICAYNLSTGIKSSSHTLTDEELALGYIYGMAINDGVLTYGLASKPNAGVTTNTYILHTHEYGKPVTENATCTENGTETRKCESCGEADITLIPATGHTPGAEATCTEGQVCTVCQEELAAAKGHTPGAEATCTESQVCTVCQKELKAALGHDYEAVGTLTEATCNAEGSEKIRCRVCQNEETRKIPKTEHTPGKEATCTESQVCTVCREELSAAKGHIPGAEATCTESQVCTVCRKELKAALGHDYEAVATLTEATCSLEGSEKVRCRACQNEETRKIPKEEHTPGAEATCTESQVCTVCNEELKAAKGHTPGAEATCTEGQVCTVCRKELKAALGHDYEAVSILTEATCNAEGSEKIRCRFCQNEETRKIPKTEHTPGAEATCTESQVCTVCNEELKAAKGHTPGAEATCTEGQVCMVCHEELAAAKGHDYDVASTIEEATCAAEGSERVRCRVCQNEETRKTAKTEHKPGTEATCTEGQVCTVCGEELAEAKGHTPGAEATCTEGQICTVCREELAAAKGHDYEAVSIITEATCNEEGSEKIRCRACQNEETRKIAKTEHIPGTEATCTDPQICTVCGEELEAAKGHIPGAEATCTEAQICTVCRKELKAAKGHQHTYTEIKAAATFTKTGKEDVICEDCGKVIDTGIIPKEKCKKNQAYQVGNYEYKILNPDTSGKGTVIFNGLKKNVSKVTIAGTVTILGTKFKVVQVGDRAIKNKVAVKSVTIGKNVTSIGKEAFSGNKNLKKITIKSTKLKKVGKNAFYRINAKAKIKVPKSKLKKYRSLLKGKGQKKTVKVASK